MSIRFQGSSSAKYSVGRQFDVIVCAVGVTAAAIRRANAATDKLPAFYRLARCRVLPAADRRAGKSIAARPPQRCRQAALHGSKAAASSRITLEIDRGRNGRQQYGARANVQRRRRRRARDPRARPPRWRGHLGAAGAEGGAQIADAAQRVQVEVEVAVEARQAADVDDASAERGRAHRRVDRVAGDEVDDQIGARAGGRLQYLVRPAWHGS